MDDTTPLPAATPGLINTLRRAALLASDPLDRERLELLASAYSQAQPPTLAVATGIAAFTGEGTLSAGGTPVPMGSGAALQGEGNVSTGQPAITREVTISDAGIITDTVTATRTTQWNVEEATKDAEGARNYLQKLKKWATQPPNLFALASLIERAVETVLKYKQ